MRGVVVAGLLLLGVAQERAGGLGMGVGEMTCGQFAAQYMASPSNEDYFFDWAQGFLSGANAMSLADTNLYRDLTYVSTVEQRGYIRNYCNDHPLVNYHMAVAVLYQSLPLRARGT